MLVRAISLLNLVRHEWRRDVNNPNQPSLMELALLTPVHVYKCTSFSDSTLMSVAPAT